MSKIQKLVTLFAEGKTITIPLPEGAQFIIWVQKLSPFYNEQCIHEGRVARSRLMLAIKEVGTKEYDLWQAQVADSSDEALIAAMSMRKEDELLARVMREIRTEEEWRERIEVIEHSGEQLEGMAPESVDVKQITKMLEEYQGELVRRVQEANIEFRNELRTLSREVLVERTLETWVEAQGLIAFTEMRRRYEIYYGARQCFGIYDGALAKWDHKECDHTQLLLDEPGDVKDLPEEVQTLVTATLMEITVPPDLARFMDGPTSSSDSPGPTSQPEDSEASLEETSASPVTT